jgi:hypothetical protein
VGTLLTTAARPSLSISLVAALATPSAGSEIDASLETTP